MPELSKKTQKKNGDKKKRGMSGVQVRSTSLKDTGDVMLRIVAAGALVTLIFCGMVGYFLILEAEYAKIAGYAKEVLAIPRHSLYVSAGFAAFALSYWIGKLLWQNAQLKKKLFEVEKDRRTFKVAVDNSINHIVLTDEKGRVTYANEAAEDVTGFSLQEMKGKKAGNRELWGGLMERDFYKKMWKMIKVDKEPFLAELTNKRKSGEKYKALLSIAPVLDDDGNVIAYVEVERDITREYEIDRSKNDFVSMASHQLRTPLSVINWYTEMLLAGDAGKVSKTQREYLEEIYNGVKRMIDLINALLNRSRLELGSFKVEPEKVDLVEIGDQVLKDLRHEIEKKGLKVKKTYEKRLPKVKADPKLMYIILENLLSNAVKYTSEKGTIELVIRKEGKDIWIEVHDTGCGIPKPAQAHIFSKLFRGENVQEMGVEGTGLGLFIVKSILDNTVGNVWFESEEGKGTVFYVTIPVRGMKKKVGEKELES
jgi:PAS domain S-box-containing protein